MGDSNVGKTSLLQKFVYNRYDPNYSATIGLDFGCKHICYNNKVVKLNLFDTGGHERYESVNRVYYKHTDGVIIVCSVDDVFSRTNLGKWLDECHEFISYRQDDFPIYIVYNKSDLKEDLDQSVVFFATSNDLPYYVTSVPLNKNIDDLFLTMTNDLIRVHSHQKKKDEAPFRLKTAGKIPNGCC